MVSRFTNFIWVPNLRATQVYKSSLCGWHPEERPSSELPGSSFDSEKKQGMMSACNVNGGLVFYFLEMARRRAVLFLETAKIKGYLKKPKTVVSQLLP